MSRKIREVFARKPNLVFCFGLLFLGLHVFIGLKKELLYIGGDTGIPLNPLKDLNLLYLWQHQEGGIIGWNLGIIFQLLFFAFFKYLGLSLSATQHLYIYFAHTLAGLGMYYLVCSFHLKHQKLVAFISSIFYMFSPWLINYLGIFVFFPYSVMPFILGTFVRGIKGEMDWIKAALLISFLFLGIIINFPQYSMFFVAILMMALYLLFYLVVYRGNFWRAVKFCLLLAFFMILTSLWFILPYWRIFSSRGIETELKSNIPIPNAIHNFGDYGFSTILNLLRMFGAAGLLKGGAVYSDFYLNNSFLILTSFLIPFLFFSALIFKSKSKAVLFFSLIAIIFIFVAKGVNPPLGFFHFWLVSKIPFARAFRTTWNLSLGANLAFSFLIGVAVVEIAYRISGGNKKSLIFVISILISLLLFISWPLISGDYFRFKWNPPSFEGVKVPNAYYELEDYLSLNQEDSRFFKIPESQGMIKTNWGYFGSDFSFTLFSTPFISGHPVAKTTNSLIKGIYERVNSKSQLEPEVLKTLSLLNVRKIIFDDYDKTLPFKVEKPIPGQHEASLQTKIGLFEIYNLDNDYFLPHFYIPERIIYTNVSESDYLRIVNFPDYQKRSSIFSLDLRSQGKLGEIKNEEIIIITDPLVSLELENRKQRILDRVEAESQGVFFPYARWRPGSFIYSLVLKKENLSLKASGQRSDEIIDKNLLFAGKRIVELTHWGANLNDQQWKQISNLYQHSMEVVFSELEKIYQAGNLDLFTELLSKIESSLLAHQKRLKEAFSSGGDYFERIKTMDKTFENFKKKVDEINELPNLFNLTYNFEIPEQGYYELFFNDNKDNFEEMFSNFVGIKINNQQISIADLSLKDRMIKIDKPQFYQKGQYNLELSFKESENLLTERGWNSEQNPLFEKGDGLVTFRLFPLPPLEESSIVYQEIPRYIPDAFYQLSFDYSAKDDQAKVVIVQDTDIGKEKGEITPLVLKQLPGSENNQFTHFKTIFKSSPNSKRANIYLLIKQKENILDSVNVNFKNIKLQRIFSPRLVLRAKFLGDTEIKQPPPRLTFTKINPTKYKVKIEGAVTPYLLVFSEAFHPGWKVYLSNQEGNEETITNHFSDLVKEGKHQNIFLAKSTFETWGQKEIAKSSHYLVNGYANAWQIFPEEIGRKSCYELIVEFEPQRLFYLGAAIYLFTFLSCFIYLLFKRKKKK